MCHAIPGRVKGIEGKFAQVDYFGEERRAINELADLNVGDYVFAQGGFVISRISAREAEATLETWKDLFFELQSIDEQSVKISPWAGQRYQQLRALMGKAQQGEKISREDQKYLLQITDPGEMEFLFNAANFLRQDHHKNSCCVHGIVEISNHCGRNCFYCGISIHNRGLTRYRMSRLEILAAVRDAVERYGFKALVLQSAEDSQNSIEDLAETIRLIKKEFGVLIFVSFGEIGSYGLETLYTAGARGILLRFETSNPGLYTRLHPGYSLENRVAEIRRAYEIGYLIVTGSLIGLPGQTADDIINDLELASQLKVEMLSMGPFLPHPQTPLAKDRSPTVNEMIKTLRAAVFVMPERRRRSW